mgnify:CR=1 FL=1
MEKSKYTQKEFYLLIKKNLRRLHYQSGYSRAYVAEQMDISFQAYSDMLTLSLVDRYPSLETMRRFCLFFQVDISEFFKPINENILQKN